METTHQRNIPGPLPYVMKVLDKRDETRCQYSFAMLCQLVLIAISAKPENILALSQWLDDNKESLFALGFRTRKGEKQVPSQATIYRFFWALKERIVKLEHHLSRWACSVLENVRVPGELIRIGVDGKQIKGSKRVRRGEKAHHLLACFVHELGLSLNQGAVTGDEAKAALNLNMVSPMLMPLLPNSMGGGAVTGKLRTVYNISATPSGKKMGARPEKLRKLLLLCVTCYFPSFILRVIRF